MRLGGANGRRRRRRVGAVNSDGDGDGDGDVKELRGICKGVNVIFNINVIREKPTIRVR